MWSKYGLLDVKAHTNGNCFFKFRSEAGLNEVLEKGPWIVNNRPIKNDFNGMRKNGGLWRKKTGNNGKQSMQNPNNESNTVQNKTWPLQKEDFNAMKKTANKYVVLGEMDEDERNELRNLKKIE
ncbi:RNA-directed DNA polymerase, eukaryota, reverse transcriptase zinc-binding domain protein [Tanacetum coccineum]